MPCRWARHQSRSRSARKSSAGGTRGEEVPPTNTPTPLAAPFTVGTSERLAVPVAAPRAHAAFQRAAAAGSVRGSAAVPAEQEEKETVPEVVPPPAPVVNPLKRQRLPVVPSDVWSASQERGKETSDVRSIQVRSPFGSRIYTSFLEGLAAVCSFRMVYVSRNSSRA